MGRLGCFFDRIRGTSIYKCVVADTTDLIAGHDTLRIGEPLIHSRSLYRPRITAGLSARWVSVEPGAAIFSPSDDRAVSRLGRHSNHHSLFYGGAALLQEMPRLQARPDASLLDMQTLCIEDGPPLPMAVDVPGWACFANSAWWMWKELFEESGYLEEMAPINTILLAVISGIIGLVLTGFTSWHIYLCAKGQTTIEKLEKTRYLSSVRSRVERNRQEQQLNQHRRGSEGVAERLQRAGEQILEFHANAVPGASRYEEGEEHTSPVPSVYNPNLDHQHHHPQHPNNYTQETSYHDNTDDTPALRALRRTYSNIEAERERERFSEYMDDYESEKMPNAFDLGWRRNLSHLFGPIPLLWCLPVCNTTGDGWRWEVSQTWLAAQEEAARWKEQRLETMRNEQQHNAYTGVGMRGGDGGYAAGFERDRDHQEYGRSMQSAMSMHHLPHQQQQQQQQRGRQRTDFDRGENGQVERFQVSSSDGESQDSDSDSDIGYDDHDDAERGWKRRNRAARTGR
ncbi:palmitoyltransferase for Vac8p [Exophiala xenobiotica]|nr:palmitoyltransferase for Vac8p [Exophiala xenobiotica]